MPFLAVLFFPRITMQHLDIWKCDCTDSNQIRCPKSSNSSTELSIVWFDLVKKLQTGGNGAFCGDFQKLVRLARGKMEPGVCEK